MISIPREYYEYERYDSIAILSVLLFTAEWQTAALRDSTKCSVTLYHAEYVNVIEIYM